MTEAMTEQPNVRLAYAADAPEIGRLLHDFNREYGEPTPTPDELARRIVELIAVDTAVLVGRSGPDTGGEIHGLAVLRFRPSLWSRSLESYLAELYVVPGLRGQGLGRAIMAAAIDHARARGADHMELGTEETDTAARALYESLGFTNRVQGALSYYYERDL